MARDSWSLKNCGDSPRVKPRKKFQPSRPFDIFRAVSPAKRGIERLETERGIISNGAFITFKILKKISVRLNQKMLPIRDYSKHSANLIHSSIPYTMSSDI